MDSNRPAVKTWRGFNLALRNASADDNEIEAALKRVIELNASHAEAHYERALLFNRRDQAPEAAASFRRAVDLAPGLTEVHRELAKAAVASEDWPTAAREWLATISRSTYGTATGTQPV